MSSPAIVPAKKRAPSQLTSLTAGVIAGAIEGAVTYPAEFIKTKAQFSRSGQGAVKGGVLPIIVETVKQHGVRGLYYGAGALIAGNGLKAGVRFMTYDGIKAQLVDHNGKLSTTNGMLAGLAAGIIEAIVAVTPSETIKTKLIDDAARMQPRYTNLVNGTVGICRAEGFGGIYRGLVPTILKQGANSTVRFTTFNALTDLATNWRKPVSGNLGSTETFLAGAGAGLVTVYATMPLDNVKTRMQSLGAEGRYRNSLDCFMQIVKHEGVARLWGGTTPRLARLMLSGGIVFAVYNKMIELTDRD